MARQHATPLLVPADGPAVALAVPGGGQRPWSEAAIQSLVHAHPSILPIREIDPLFADPIPICTELNTPAGPVDNFMMTASGLPVLVECKLWSNPEARREVVGQILDYAKELTRWTSSDVQREASHRLRETGNPLIARVRAAGHDVDEAEFNDALSRNLRTGRSLLLIVGEGIRERVEAIAEYLQGHAGLHFTLGLVELPVYAMPDGGRLVVPRVIAHTTLIRREVISLPDGMIVADGDAPQDGEPGLDPMAADRLAFWSALLDGFRLDDPEQALPKPARQGYVAFMLPAPSGSCWLTAWRNIAEGKVGVYLSYSRNSVGERAVRQILDEQWPDVAEMLGGAAAVTVDKIDRRLIGDEARFAPLAAEPNRAAAIGWLRVRINDFVTVLRPRIRDAVAALKD